MLRLGKNLCSGIIAVVAGVTLMLMLPYHIKSKVNNMTAAVGPEYLPRLVIYLMIACGIALIFTSLVLKKEEYVEIELKRELHSMMYFAALVVYVVMMQYLGFIISSALFGLASLMLMEDRNPRHIGATMVLVAAVALAFRYGLNVPLP